MKIKELYEQIRDGKIISDIDLQREIIYSNSKQEMVIDSIVSKIPLPAFYFWKNEEDVLEVLDGKQRIEAIKKFIQNDIQYNGKLWRELDEKTQLTINNTELSVIICSGTENLKREIFRRINTLGVPLSDYEVLNGLYHGEYLRGLTQYVSTDKSVNKVLGPNSRGKHQIKILKFICQLKNEKDLQRYVEENQNISFDKDMRLIKKYIDFIKDIFNKYTELSILFKLSVKYLKDKTIWKDHKTEINNHLIKAQKDYTWKLIDDKEKEFEDIIQAVVNGIHVDDKRLFTIDDKKLFIEENHLLNNDNKCQCELCKHYFYVDELQMDHVFPWSKGGRTVLSNAQLLCGPCNSHKNNKISP